MTEEEIRKLIRNELSNIFKIDRYVWDKKIQILDARNIQLGRGTGTKIGTVADQKISVYGVTPVVQAGAITTPTAPGALYAQAEAASAKTAIDAIRNAIKNFGITA